MIYHTEEYARASDKISPVNVANVYRKDLNREEAKDAHGVETNYDFYKAPSMWAVDHLPFKGLEEIVDIKKFTTIIRQLERNGFSGEIKI
jgi:hypothetical protein